jgi:hypothetical protein
MNSQKLARSTLVLDRSVHEDLSYLAHRFGVSRSSLVREVLSEPVTMMAKWARSVPAGVTPAGLAEVTRMLDSEVADFVDLHTTKLEVGNG